MSFLTVVLALLIEQFRPLPPHNPVHGATVGWTRWIGRNFDAGREHHAWVVWGLAVGGPTVAAAAVWMLLLPFSTVLALAWNVLVLYLCMGFRQFSHHFTAIRDADERGDEDEARRLLSAWAATDLVAASRGEWLRLLIEHALMAAHRHVFGVFFCFVVLSALGLGPAGAVLYRLAEFQQRYWPHKHDPQDGRLPTTPLAARARILFAWIDHLPARLTAFGFAVVGNFEEAVAQWRREASQRPGLNDNIVLAAAAGAVGVPLGAASALPGDAQAGHLHSVVGLVWRSVVLWLALLALLTVSNLIG